MITVDTIDMTAQLIPAVWAIIGVLCVSGLGIVAASIPRMADQRRLRSKEEKNTRLPALTLPASV